MAFIESPRFMNSIALGAVGGPRYSTDVVELESGHEQRNQVWSEARARWTIALVPMNETDRNAVLAFIRGVAKGRLNGFRFKDFNDWDVVYAESTLSLVSANVYQLKKRYTSGSNTHDRTIAKPVVGTVVVRDGSTVLVAGADYTIDTTLGRITMLGAAVPSSWKGEFDVPVRLDSDEALMRAINRGDGLITEWQSIELIELRI